MTLRAPRGRPPRGCFWRDGGWVSIETGEPLCATHRREHFLQRRRSYEQTRYWDGKTGVRKRRLERSASERGAQAKVKHLQLKLTDFTGGRVQRIQKINGTTSKSTTRTMTSNSISNHFLKGASTQDRCRVCNRVLAMGRCLEGCDPSAASTAATKDAATRHPRGFAYGRRRWRRLEGSSRTASGTVASRVSRTKSLVVCF